MDGSKRKDRCRRRPQRYEWVQLAALSLTAVTAIAGCVERFM